MKHIGIATFAAGLLLATAAFAEPHHGGGGGGGQHAAPAAPHGGGAHFAAPRGGGGGFAPRGGAPRASGGFSRGGGMSGFSHAPSSGGYAHFEHRNTMERAPSGLGAYQQRGTSRGGYANFEHRGTHAPSSIGTQRGTTGGYANFEHRGGTRGGNYGTMGMPSRGMERPRGISGENAAYTHGTGIARTPQRGVGQQNYGRDPRGYGMRPSNWNERPRNFNRGDYQFNATATDRFHWGSYDRPDGWYYRRWGWGDYLPAAFWARDYWLTSWWLFDLAIPPYGYQWVRYGDDALLVNVYTGQILEVEYGVFY